MEKKESSYTVGGNVNRAQSICTVCKFLKKIRAELPHDPAIPLLGTYPKKTKIQKDTCRDFPGGPMVKTPPFSAWGAQIPFLVRDLRSHRLCCRKTKT